MKKLLPAYLLCAISLLFSNTMNAQVKIGYFNEQKALKLFPGINMVDTLMDAYKIDSVGPEFERRTNQFRTLDSLNKKDCKTAIPGKSCEEVVQELNRQQAVLTNWFQIAQRMIAGKEAQLLYPYKKKMFDALQEIMAEGGYTWVLDTESLSPYFTPPLLDNLMVRIALKLQLPLSKSTMDAWKTAEAKAAKAVKPAPAGVKKK
ncbi:MAG: OmpH family outer membrane protein [Bacteroidota bacterium]